MGNTFEIHSWWQNKTLGENYRWHLEWSGESLIAALWKMHRLKRAGDRCLKLEWRT